MATYVNDLRLKEITTGDESGTWGTSTNTNLSLVADAFSLGTKNMAADANETFTMPDATADGTRSLYLKITSAVSLTVTRTVTLGPNTVSKVWIIENATTGSQSITIAQGSGATVTIATGTKAMIVTDGAGSGAAVFNANPTAATSGTVTSVAATVPSLLSIAGSPITSSGTLAFTYSGTALPVANGGTGQTTYLNGELLIGNTTGNTLTKSTLTAGTGVTIANSTGSITISATGSGGTVTSVGQTFTGGLISVSGSPVTGAGTLALTVAGTSGGIPYFSGAATWASSGVLAANSLVVGGGAAVAPSTVTTGTGVVTALGVNTGTAGAFVVNGGALGTPTSGTLTNATGLPLTTGVTGILPVANGGTNLASGTSGGVLAYTASGTLASSAALTQYGVVYGGGAGAVPVATAAGTTGQVLTATTGSAPTWATPAASGASVGQAIAFSLIFGL